jgi:7,8-dihydropterin-6-yl-methyl-4-(beta-D-ribofuranosyl)aminobenzene 5'-phosphate synthase
LEQLRRCRQRLIEGIDLKGECDMSVELIMVVENTPGGQDGVRGDHGLAVLLSGPGGRWLFDTGPDPQLLRDNAAALGVDLNTLDGVVLSHGHPDHTNGLTCLMREGLPVYAHPTLWRKRWVEKPGEPLRDISCQHSRETLQASGLSLRNVDGPLKLTDWLVLSGPIGGPKWGREVFVLRRGDDLVVDGFEDEMFCLVRGQHGWAVVTGCCHRGLRNTLRTARFLAGDEPIAGVFGGLHLRSANDDELNETVAVLTEAGSPDLYPCHCTGANAIAFLARAFPGKVNQLSAGNRMVW